jgi:hypothetical protein
LKRPFTTAMPAGAFARRDNLSLSQDFRRLAVA